MSAPTIIGDTRSVMDEPDVQWFMRYAHEAVLRGGVYRVRVWHKGKRKPPAEGQGATFKAALVAARGQA